MSQSIKACYNRQTHSLTQILILSFMITEHCKVHVDTFLNIRREQKSTVHGSSIAISMIVLTFKHDSLPNLFRSTKDNDLYTPKKFLIRNINLYGCKCHEKYQKLCQKDVISLAVNSSNKCRQLYSFKKFLTVKQLIPFFGQLFLFIV